MQELATFAIELAHGAGAIVQRAFLARGGEVTHKSTLIDLVTQADKDAEDYLLGELGRRFPDHAVLAEESGAGREEGPFRWILDPLDGTVNMAHRLPHFAVLIAVQRHEDDGSWRTVVGVTYDPLRQELFVAQAGDGARLNGESIHVSSAARLIDTIGATGFAYNRLFRPDDNHAEFCRLNLLTQGVRRLGSAGLDLAYLACGRLDFFWEYGLNPWDLAAGALLVQEAGGTLTAVDGGPVDLFAGNVAGAGPALHPSLVAALASARQHAIGSREGLAAFLPPELAGKLHR